ncbi:MAG TPA: hypothetical protein VF803_02885 [Candidatus Paceibacterota bacterium]
MRFSKMTACLALLLAMGVSAEDDAVVIDGPVPVCRTQKDAEAIIDAATSDAGESRSLFKTMTKEGRCGSYTGTFTVDEVIQADDSSVLVKITTESGIDLYLFVVLQPAEDTTLTA